MNFNIDLIVFIFYIALVFAIGIFSAGKSKNSEDYFLAGRKLTWWIIGGSLIAANISTHHFIGMSGQGFSIGLAIASYEWLAAIVLILVGKFFLPYFLKSKIVTMPEFLANRFNKQVQITFAIISLFGYIFIELAVVLFTGALAIQSLFGLPIVYGLAILFFLVGAYTLYGGLKSVAYTDVIHVTILITGGLVVTYLGLTKIGILNHAETWEAVNGLKTLFKAAPEKFKMVQPIDHPELPWIGVFFGGIWLANIFYWGCNQFITQKTLAAKDIWHGQMGLVFAGFLKLLVPVLVVLPGIIAFTLYDPSKGLLAGELTLERADLAFPTLLKELLPVGLSGLVMASLMGAVMSTVASLLTSSSSIITLDVYRTMFKPKASERQLIKMGRFVIVGILIIATVFGYFLQDIDAIFTYIQQYWSIAYPAISAIFIAGFFYKKATGKGALWAMVLGPTWAIIINLLQAQELIPTIPFLNRVIVDFIICWVILFIFRNKTGVYPATAIIDRSFSPEDEALLNDRPFYSRFNFWSIILIAIVVTLYIVFF
ncbi:sodium/solute symporter [uncultured Draconibacterium sp.]|uniref:SLC5 family protein n=1 Tax=uncultured Draconibacterium sp. TaxID=1573823 RepID=UPI003260789A